MKVSPLGLFISEAILATNLFTDTPAEAVSCSPTFIACFICLAISIAEPIFNLSSVTSNKLRLMKGVLPNRYKGRIFRVFFVKLLYRQQTVALQIKHGGIIARLVLMALPNGYQISGPHNWQ